VEGESVSGVADAALGEGALFGAQGGFDVAVERVEVEVRALAGDSAAEGGQKFGGEGGVGFTGDGKSGPGLGGGSDQVRAFDGGFVGQDSGCIGRGRAAQCATAVAAVENDDLAPRAGVYITVQCVFGSPEMPGSRSSRARAVRFSACRRSRNSPRSA
jgi:hypothetical protein